MSRANELIGAAVEALAREDQAAFDAAAAFLADRDDADRVLLEAASRAISALWRNGWQPADVVRIAARRLSDWHGRVASDLVAWELRAYPPATVDERWRDQLAGLEAAVWWKGGYLAARQARDGAAAGRLMTVSGVLELLGLLTGLPRLESLGPPPGAARRTVQARSHTVSEKTLARVRALLAKAESTTYEAEAQTFTSAAQRLMAKYSIDAAMLDARPGGGEAPAGIRVGVDAPYEQPKAVLLNLVAEANRCRVIWSRELGFATVLGFAADLSWVEMLFTSLLVQAQTALVNSGTKKHGAGRSRSKAFRQSFLSAFAARIGERLAEATADAVAQESASRGTDLVPVLAAREQEVEQAVERMFPSLVSHAVRTSWDREGWAAGRTAADRASLGTRDR
ncbi:DUF2786 domain-containing protein [Actinomadura sp. ATCC 31491]|uniref:DUF2786 domain-containing protein n=1 Tax=Actinomadura luzonensis TaxID=2805427 RepID=A0ABT0G759_9ACTN|nr:DUF2786 domain-containing protein [Actinomadura luzonensis]MCK2220427.1 DUF2786 domain-containing protein [Actinomadura luzonensis]